MIDSRWVEAIVLCFRCCGVGWLCFVR